MPERKDIESRDRPEVQERGIALEDLVEAMTLGRPATGQAAEPATAEHVAGPLLVGECVDATHPTLRGRVLVRIVDTAGEATERWLPTLYRLPVREADRVLLALPGNWEEAVVIGVIDGFARRPEAPTREGVSLVLAADECLRVKGEDGTSLVEVRQDEEGPVVRLLQPRVDVEVPGAFRVRADEIRLEARKGSVELQATHDVVVRGEIIRLN
ncbi:MAG: hypothetical protein LJF04_19280 [Gemmatimonadetes bacterium]|nr:hypothetical protein [Gemmatimonadota bacterium]